MKNPKAKINSELSISKVIENAKNPVCNIGNDVVSISTGNKKLGSVANISLPPVVTCHNCNECKKFCYAIRTYNQYKTVRNAWNKNLAIYNESPVTYFNQISRACYTVRFFRWHVSGDIVNYKYLSGMVKVANENKHCEFLAFTKNYNAINGYLSTGLKLPNNLHILFSIAPNTPYNNPYNVPECHISFEDTTLNTFKGCKGSVYHCTGNCEECIANGCGCFNLKNGDVTIINQH